MIHSTQKLSLPKTQSAKEFIASLNPSIKVTTYQERLTQSNALSLIRQFDVVIDGCDNALTRYLVNDACVVLKKPLVSGASVQWEGQVTVYNFQNGPCYRCLYPSCPPATSMMSCSGNGVFGPAPGMVGTITVTECAKIILGQGDLLVGKMLLVDLLNLRFKTVRVRLKKKGCMCNAFRTELVDDSPKFNFQTFDYEKFVGISCKMEPLALDKEMEIDWEELEKALIENEDNSKMTLVDVRNQNHHGIVHLKQFQSVNIEHFPLEDLRNASSEELQHKYSDLEKIYIFCRSGVTSKEATMKLKGANLPAINVVGGVLNLLKKQSFEKDFVDNL